MKKFIYLKYILFFAGICLLHCHATAQRVRLGAELLIEKNLDLIKDKRVGIICNHTSVLPNGVHLVDTLVHLGINVTALFAPEHGIRGDVAAGAKVQNQTDPATGLLVYSLYGGTRKPTQDMLAKVDVLLFDMQDIGARFYTYASTMAYVMEAAAENGKKMIVLDRPNPINGVDIEGPVLDLRLISFVGLFPIPVRHGLTLGELARMLVGEGYINPSTVDLTVVPMEGWKRTMWYDQTHLPWIAPSPNMKTLSTATVYPGTCLFEATNISEGRGTKKPFEYIGAPGINPSKLIAKLESLQMPGVVFKPIEFTPRGDSAGSANPKFTGKRCKGVFVQVIDRKKFQPVLTGLMLLDAFKELYPHKFQLKQGLLDHLIGDQSIGENLQRSEINNRIFDTFKSDVDQYRKTRAKYLLY